MRSLSDDIYELYIDRKVEKIRNLSAYTLGSAVAAQALVGDENSLKFSVIVSLLSGILAYSNYKIKKNNKPYYEESKENLKNVANELILYGYDLSLDALEKSTLWDDGIIEYSDKDGNSHYIYEDDKNSDEIKYYHLTATDKEISKESDITEIINRGLTKHK